MTPPPRTAHGRRLLHDDAYAEDIYQEMLAEEAAIEAEFQATRRQPWDGACAVCGRDSAYSTCARCDDELSREDQERTPAPWFSPGTPP